MGTRGSALGGSIATKIGARSLRDPLAISRMQEIAHAGTRSKKPHCCGSSDNALRRIAACGQSCWLEDLSRRMMTKGKFSRLVAEDVCGVTERMANAHARDLCGPQCQAGLSAHEMDARGVTLVNPALTGCAPPAPPMGKHQREEPGYRDLMYVEPRIGSMTISTMPNRRSRPFSTTVTSSPVRSSKGWRRRTKMRHLDGFDIRFADMAARLERESVQQLPGRSTNRSMRLRKLRGHDP